MKTKQDGIAELYRRLDELPRATSRTEAYQQLESTLDAIETERRGLSLEEDAKNYGHTRMGTFPLTNEFWRGLDSDVAVAKMRGGIRTRLHSDGTIEITKDINGQEVHQYTKRGEGTHAISGNHSEQ